MRMRLELNAIEHEGFVVYFGHNTLMVIGMEYQDGVGQSQEQSI